MFKIVKREEMAEGTVVLNEIEAPLIAQKAKPGQFVILKANETGERIPLTMADTDPAKGTITVIYQVVGKSTALFKTLKRGEATWTWSARWAKPPTSRSSAPWSASAAASAWPCCTPSPGP